LDDPLIYARALHFAATTTVAGVAFFIVLIAEPLLRSTVAPITPLVQYIQNINAAADALRQLRRNTVIEVAIGVAVNAIVAALGVIPPGHLEQMPYAHHHSH